jgi:hypothetical protein
MPYQIENKFVVAVASSALFNLSDSDQVFREQGEDAYRAYQRAHEREILNTGVAFPLIKMLLSNIFKPHIFFDDQVGHIEGVARIAPSVHVPFGVANSQQRTRTLGSGEDE